MEYRQYQVLKRVSPPASIKAEIDQETFEKSQDYSRAKARFRFILNAWGFIQNVATFQLDLLPVFWRASGSLIQFLAPIIPKFAGGIITQSVFFFLIQNLLSTVLSLPVDYYQHFVLEEKYGFNKQTVSLWINDTIKSILLQWGLGSPVVAGFLKILAATGDSFIGYLTLFVLGVQLVAMTIFPSLIHPLFNKFTPLEDGELKTAIEDLASKEGFPLGELYVVDGSKRSSHSNAYFTGLPWSKKIVLYDTLIEHSTIEETVAVLAHEIGHWKMWHLPRMIVLSQVIMLSTFSLFSAFINNKSLYNAFGFTTVKPDIVGFTLFSTMYSPVNSIFSFVMHWFSRKHEFEADKYGKDRGHAEGLATGLIKLQIENLLTMDADWLYSAYHLSHPILAERLAALEYVSKKKVGKAE